MSNIGATRQSLSLQLQSQIHHGLTEPSEQTPQTAHSLPCAAKSWCVKDTSCQMRGRSKPLQISEDLSLLKSATFPWREAKNQHFRRLKLHGSSVTSSLKNETYQIYTLISVINQLKYCMGNLWSSNKGMHQADTRQPNEVTELL